AGACGTGGLAAAALRERGHDEAGPSVVRAAEGRGSVDCRFVEAGIGRAAVARSGSAASQEEEVVAALAEPSRAAAARRSGAAHAAQSARSRADIPGGEARVLDIEIGRAAIAIAASPAGRGTAACSAEPARVDG